MDIYCSKVCSCGEDIDAALESAMKAVRVDEQTLTDKQKAQVRKNLGIESTGSSAGTDGFSPIAKVEQTTSGALITIIDKTGTTEARITNGEDGKDGSSVTVKSVSESFVDGGNNIVSFSDGKTVSIRNGSKGSDGVSPIVSVSKTGKVTTLTITDAEGTKTATIRDGADGTGGTTVADDIPSYVKDEADRVSALVQSRQNADTISFIACSDLHYSSVISTADKQLAAMTHMGQAMGLIRKKAHIDFAVMLGDMIYDSTETADQALSDVRFVNSCLHDGFSGIPNFRTRGNHDNGYNCGADFTDAQVFANIGIYNTGAVYDSNNRIGGYCYRDFDDLKLRVVCLNSSETGGCLFTSAQVTWLESALNVSSGWRSIILSHHPLDWGKDGGVNPISTITAASGVIAAFHGHIHNFKVDKVTGTNLTRIAIPNACNGRESEYTTAYGIAWNEDAKYTKTEGTAEDTSFCVVTIDMAAEKIYADHYGAGYSREISFAGVVNTDYSVTNNLVNVTTNSTVSSVTKGDPYTATLTAVPGYEITSVTVIMGGNDVTSTAYNNGIVDIESVTGNISITATATLIGSGDTYDVTNLIGYAEEPNSTALYNGTGYKNGVYCSSSGGDSDDPTCVSTGYIPYTWISDNVIYVRGAAVTATSHVRIYGYAGKGGTPTGSSMCTGSNLDTHFTIERPEGEGVDYYKLTPKNGVNTVTYLRLSLIGTGENLIVTVNEPIE